MTRLDTVTLQRYAKTLHETVRPPVTPPVTRNRYATRLCKTDTRNRWMKPINVTVTRNHDTKFRYVKPLSETVTRNRYTTL